MALSYNLGYQESISVHPTRHQNFAGKPYSNFPNIWEWLMIYVRNVRCHACDTGTDEKWKVVQYSVWAESAIFPTCSLVQAHTVKAHKKKYQCKDPLMLKYECVLCRNKFRKNKYLRNHQENIIIILVNVMIKGAFANKRGRRVPQTLKDSAACVANVAS